MLKYSFVFLQVAVVGISVWGVYGLTKEEEAIMEEILKPIIMECMDECSLKLDGKEDKEGENCLKKCMLKKLGVLTEDGKYDADAVKVHITATTDTEETAKKYQKTLDDCLKGKDLDLINDKDDEKKVNIIFECLEKLRMES